jgi:hypothetical protein
MDQRVEMGRVLGDWKRSGLSLRAFGRRKGLAYTKLVYWRRKLHSGTRNEEEPAVGRSLERWLPVRVVPSPIAGGDARAVYEVWLANGLRVGVSAGFDAEELTRLVQALSSC